LLNKRIVNRLRSKFANIIKVVSGGKMKKFKLGFAFLLTVILLVTACSKDDNPTDSNDPFVGTWTLTKIKVNLGGGYIDMTPESAQTTMQIIAKNDKSYKMTVVQEGVSTTYTGKYTLVNNRIEVVYDDGTQLAMEYTLVGNKLTIQTNVPFQGATVPGTLEFTKQ
jgi:hypothetical protein